jgi:hypothetical protein
VKTSICPECGKSFEQTGGRGKPRVFCSDDHKAAHASRMTVRGKQLAKIALGWRLARGSGDLGKFLFAEMTTMLDDWNSEDKAAGRMRADDYAALVCDFNSTNPQWSRRYFDRQPTKKQVAARKATKQENA